ncbi:MAG: hypothetical protein ACTHK7_07210 [Aureliella sp.]
MTGHATKPAGRKCRIPRIVASRFIVPVILMTFAGCGADDWHARTYPASGRITVNGQAAEGADVTLHPRGQKIDQRGSNPWGIAQADGSFTLSTYKHGDGAPQGEYAVTVRWPVDVTDMSAAMVDRLGGAYANAERSQWEVAIEQGENELPPIEIQGAKVNSQQHGRSHRRAPPMPGTHNK